MFYPISEFADRLSICQLKVEKTKGKESQPEYDYLLNHSSYYLAQFKEFHDYVQRLYEINSKIWELEASIRAGTEKELGLEEIGRRAIQIRDYNKMRVSIKNEIVQKTAIGFEDIKVNHRST